MTIDLPPVPEGQDGHYIAYCPRHGLHGQRARCFICDKPVNQVPMLPSGPVQPRDPTKPESSHRPWRCRLGMHTAERSQGLVGYCMRDGCDHLRDRAYGGQGAWLRYTEQPHRPPPRPSGPAVGSPPPKEVHHHYHKVPYAPDRYDEVAKWLRLKRNECDPGGLAYRAIDSLLDEYRERSDYGLSLEESMVGKGDDTPNSRPGGPLAGS